MADIDDKDRSRGDSSGGGGGGGGRDRDRSRRGDRPSRFSEGSNIRDRSNERGGGGGGGGSGRKSSSSRVYVSNISYEYRWQDLKDLFREKVGDVAFVELFVDDHDKPKGCGIVEFSDSSSVKKCMEVMHRFELNGRKLVIKEDFGNERDKFGNIINGRRNRDRERQMMDKLDWDDMRDNRRGGGGSSGGGGGGRGDWDHHHQQQQQQHHTLNNPPSLMNLMSKEPLEYKWGNTFGLSPQFLESLNINRPLVNRVFVANLDYKVDEKKLRDVFKLCGKVLDVELYHDKDGNSRGFAVVEYDHPVESVQAISMLHNQMLFERPMIVRMDRIDHDAPTKLPDGLKGVGMGLGMNGEPLRDVSRNLPSSSSSTNTNGGGTSGGGGNNGGNGGGGGAGSASNAGPGILGAMPNQTSLQALGSTAAALSSVVNNSGLAGLSGSSAAALQASLAGVQAAPFLNLGQNLSSADLGGLGNLTSSNLGSLSTSLAQNHALASLASANSMGGGSSANLNSSLMAARGLVGNNNDRDYNSRNDGGSGGGSGASGGYMLSSNSGGGGGGGLSSNQQSNASQMMGSRGMGGGGNSGGINEYTSSNMRDYDSNASMRSQYDDMQDSFRQQTSIYSTVNNGSQNRTGGGGSNNMNMSNMKSGYSDTIIVSNLPISATWKMMREKFCNVGDVQFVDMKSKDNQAIVRFSSEWQAERAIKLMDRQRIDGRTIDVRFCY